MVKLRNPRERASAPRTVGRRFKSIAAVVATSMVAPAAFAGVATTVATTLTASPAAASPVRTFVVSGDADSRNFGAWTFFGSDYSQLRSIITSASNFGPTGTVKTASFSLGTPVSTVSDSSLAGIDVFVSGAVEGGYSGAEEAALQRFVNRGGMLLLNTNSAEYDTSRFYGFVPKDPQAIFDATVSAHEHHGAQVTNPANGGEPAGVTYTATPEQYEAAVQAAVKAFETTKTRRA